VHFKLGAGEEENGYAVALEMVKILASDQKTVSSAAGILIEVAP